MQFDISICYCGKCKVIHNTLCIGGVCGCFKQEKDFLQVIEEEII